MSHVSRFYKNSAKGKIPVDRAWLEKLLVDTRMLFSLGGSLSTRIWVRMGPDVTCLALPSLGRRGIRFDPTMRMELPGEGRRCWGNDWGWSCVTQGSSGGRISRMGTKSLLAGFSCSGPGGDIISLEALFIAYTPTTHGVLKPTCIGLRESTNRFAEIFPVRC